VARSPIQYKLTSDRVRRSRRVLASTLLVAHCACGPSEQPPEFVYLRTDSVSVVVSITARSPSRIRVGEWLPLSATRSTTGSWRKVRFGEVPDGVRWLGGIPPEHEPEVAANLQWYAEPMEGVEFDSWVPRPVPVLERAVRFSRPGTYRLRASSHPPLDATSNTIEVEVAPR